MGINKNIKEEIINVIKKVFPFGEGEVYLFGSRARNDWDNQSDWDLLILTEEPVNTQEKFARYISPFAEIGWYTEEKINPINYSREEWEKRKKTFFYHNVMRDAIKL